MPLTRLTAETLRVLPRKRISYAMGRLADANVPQAVLDRAIAAFVKAYGINLSEAVIPPGGFSSFDDFFTRKLKEGARPIEPAEDIMVSPADGKVEDCGEIDLRGELRIKGRVYRVEELLDEADAEAYRGGYFAVVYLSPRDYHRVHAPVTGAVSRSRHISGTLYPVNKIGLEHRPRLFAENERVAITQETNTGKIVTVMVGAIGVGRISLAFDDAIWTNSTGKELGERTEVLRDYDDGPLIVKGAELGTFHLGSTAIVFVPKAANPAPLIRMGDTVRLGQALCRLGAE